MKEEYDPEQTAAYWRESLEKLVVSQQRMIEGTGPSRKRPGGGMRGDPAAEELIILLVVSKPMLFVRAEWCDCPDELCLPSDLCESDRSINGWLPIELPVLNGSSLADRLACP